MNIKKNVFFPLESVKQKSKKMNSIQQGRVTKKRCCCNNKMITLKIDNFILRSQVERMHFKLQHYENYIKFLEKTVSTYQMKLTFPDGILENEKKEVEKDHTVAPEDIICDCNVEEEESMIEETRTECGQNTGVMQENCNQEEEVEEEEKKDYWQCFWCLKQNGKEDYSTHILDCIGKRVFTKCYQNESLRCSKCYGVKIVFEPSQNILSEPCVKCMVCCGPDIKCTRKNKRKHVRLHKKWFSFYCECTDNYIVN